MLFLLFILFGKKFTNTENFHNNKKLMPYLKPPLFPLTGLIPLDFTFGAVYNKVLRYQSKFYNNLNSFQFKLSLNLWLNVAKDSIIFFSHSNLKVLCGLLCPFYIFLLEFKSREELMLQPQTVAEHEDDINYSSSSSSSSSASDSSSDSDYSSDEASHQVYI